MAAELRKAVPAYVAKKGEEYMNSRQLAHFKKILESLKVELEPHNVALSVINPGHFRMMIDDPLGIRMIVAAVVLQVLGALIIRKIVNVEY